MTTVYGRNTIRTFAKQWKLCEKSDSDNKAKNTQTTLRDAALQDWKSGSDNKAKNTQTTLRDAALQDWKVTVMIKLKTHKQHAGMLHYRTENVSDSKAKNT
jgi:hypothetical protein